MDLENAVLLKTFSDQTTAEIAARELEAHGIEWMITTDDCGGLLPALQTAAGVKLLVDPADAADARTILEDTTEPQFPDTG